MPHRELIIPSHPLSWRSWRFRLVVGMLALVFLVRVVWGWQAERMLAAQMETNRQRNEPVTLSDLNPKKLSDAENAWIVQMQAASAIVAGVDSPRASNDEFRDYPPFPMKWMNRSAASEKAHGKVFALMRQARGLPKSQLRNLFRTPALLSSFVSYNSARHLANTLGDAALYAHVTGDDAEAIERTLDLMHLAESMRQDSTIISQLVALAIDALANNNFQVIAPGLRFNPAATAHPVTRDQVRAVIAQLLDEEPVWKANAASLAAERVLVADLVDWYADGTWAIAPLAQRENLRANQRFNMIIDAIHLRDKPSADAAEARVPDDRLGGGLLSVLGNLQDDSSPRYSRWFSDNSGYFGKFAEIGLRNIAERRMTSVSLAAQLFRADQGRWPARLEELVPKYLPAVPIDPFQANAKPVNYTIIKGVLPGGADRPLIYCEEADARDEGPLNEPMYDWQQSKILPRAKVIRQYRDLARFEPLTQAVDHDPKKSDAPGKDAKQDNRSKQPK